jgi:hypothetical protein
MLTQNETLFEAYAACPPSARIDYTPGDLALVVSLSRRQCSRRYGRSRWPRRAMAVASDDCASGGLTFSVDLVDCGVLAPALSSAYAQNFGRIASTLNVAGYYIT